MSFVVCDPNTPPVLTPSNGVATPDKIEYTAAAGTADFVMYKTYTIPLTFVNQLFDLHGKFYSSAFSRQNIRLEMKLQPYSFAKMFFTDSICKVAGTGLEELELHIYSKKSSAIQTDINNKG